MLAGAELPDGSSPTAKNPPGPPACPGVDGRTTGAAGETEGSSRLLARPPAACGSSGAMGPGGAPATVPAGPSLRSINCGIAVSETAAVRRVTATCVPEVFFKPPAEMIAA